MPGCARCALGGAVACAHPSYRPQQLLRPPTLQSERTILQLMHPLWITYMSQIAGQEHESTPSHV